MAPARTDDKETTMRSLKTLAVALAFTFTTAGAALAAQPKTYQVTGPVLELKDDLIVVQKGKEKWEIARTPDTKVTGELKVGSKVTIEYRMAAASVEVKGAAPAGKAAAADKPAAEKSAAKAP
jgi:hypothetical protein